METSQGASGFASIVGGTITGVQGVQYEVASWAIPFIVGPTGTMANNGAVTWGTALSNAYTNGAWVHMPAASIAAGVPAAAAWLWYVGSTTTAGTFFNSTYTTGTPTKGTATAFATTGPGAFTGVITEVNGVQITVPANALGPNGKIVHAEGFSMNSTAGAKTGKAKYNGTGGTTIMSIAGGSGNTILSNIGYIQNQGATGAQVTGNVPGYVAEGTGITYLAVDTTAATTVAFTLTRAVATDVLAQERGSVGVVYGA